MSSLFGVSLSASPEDRRRARLDRMRARIKAEAIKFEKQNDKKKTIGFCEKPKGKKK